ncbi:uncharacterized protein [Amphiura filiformis]|uniref:uncharacterized protein n=1 Tax=Amphiura filiformis TaxID=82378 RepID=UPI003B21561A
MWGLHYFITFAGVTLMLLRVCASIVISPCSGVDLTTYEKQSACNRNLDCSYHANPWRIEDTLLNSDEIQRCVLANTRNYIPSSSFTSHCPPSGRYQSGVSYSDVATAAGPPCSFCFKIVIIRFKFGPAGKQCTMGTSRKRRQTNVPEYSITYINSTHAEIPVEKIGPDPVNITFTEENDGTANSQILSFSEEYQNTTVLVGPIPPGGSIRVKLSNVTYGCIGYPIMIEVKDPTSDSMFNPTSHPPSNPTCAPTSQPPLCAPHRLSEQIARDAESKPKVTAISHVAP